MNTNSTVDFFFEKPSQWQEAYMALRKIVLSCNLTEELKWGVPCYTFQGNNVVLIHGFKDYCALLFHKGVLLRDADKILIQQTKNVQSARQVRFTAVKEIKNKKASLSSYIYEAIEIEKQGLKVALKKTVEFTVPVEFKNVLNENKAFKKAFESLTPGRQRGYLLYFSQPKQSKTREARIEKHYHKILAGKGLLDD